MKIQLYTPREVSDGSYTATITDVCEVGKGKCYVQLEPSDGQSTYDEIRYWLNEKCSTKSVTYQLFEILGIPGEEIDTDNLKKHYLNAKIGIEIKDNQKNGTVYHNIVRFFEVDEDSEYDEDELDGTDEDELDEDELDEDEEIEPPKSTFRSRRHYRSSQTRNRR